MRGGRCCEGRKCHRDGQWASHAERVHSAPTHSIERILRAHLRDAEHPDARGRADPQEQPSRIREVNKEIEQLGATVKAQWAVLGRYDFVNIVEAPDEKTMARVSMELGSRGTARYETLTAIPVDDFIAAL